jgi:hypothetical protein
MRRASGNPNLVLLRLISDAWQINPLETPRLRTAFVAPPLISRFDEPVCPAFPHVQDKDA